MFTIWCFTVAAPQAFTARRKSSSFEYPSGTGQDAFNEKGSFPLAYRPDPRASDFAALGDGLSITFLGICRFPQDANV